MTLTLYFFRLILLRFVVLLAAFAALGELIDLVDGANAVLDRRGNVGDLLIYAALRLPPIMTSVFPIASLTAAIFVFAGMAAHQEIVAMRTAGVTLYRIAMAVVPAAFVIGCAYFFFWNQISPPAELRLRDWLMTSDTRSEEEKPKTHWIRLGRTVINFDDIARSGSELINVRIYERDPTSAVARRTTATRAIYEHGQWGLENATIVGPAAASPAETSARMPWTTPLEPSDALLAAIPPDQISLAQPRRSRTLGWIGANSEAFYVTRRYASFATFLVPLVMFFLALPAATGLGRHQTLSERVGLVLVAGLSFILVDGVLRAAGEAGVVPPLLGAWSALALFLVAGVSILLYIED